MKPHQFLLLFLSLTVYKCQSYNVGMTLTSSAVKPRMSTRALFPTVSAQKCCNSNFNQRNQSKLFAEDTSYEAPDDEQKGMLSRIYRLIKPKSSENLTTKELLAKMGMSCFLSYGFVSNLSYCVSISLAWFGFAKKVCFIEK